MRLTILLGRPGCNPRPAWAVDTVLGCRRRPPGSVGGRRVGRGPGEVQMVVAVKISSAVAPDAAMVGHTEAVRRYSHDRAPAVSTPMA